MAHQTINLKAVKFGYVDEEHPYEHYPVTADGRYDIGGNASKYDRKYFYIGFEKCPDEVANKKIIGVQLTTRADYYIGSAVGIDGGWIAEAGYVEVEDFDADTLNFANMPAITTYSGRIGAYPPIWFQHLSQGDTYDATGPELEDAHIYPVTGVRIARGAAMLFIFTSSSSSGNRLGMRSRLGDGSLPYLTLHYDDAVTFTPILSYVSGPKNDAYADPREETEFSWEYKSIAGSFCVKEKWGQKSATFYWRDINSEEWNTISADDTTLLVPANTFPIATTIVWYVEGTDDSGTTDTLEQYRFSTADSTAYAKPVYPVDSAVDGSKEVTFEWNLINASGSTPALVNLWWKLPAEDDNSWHEVVNSTEPVTSYTFPVDFFPSGTVQWKVRASNKDGTPGPEEEASFVCVVAPDEPEGIKCDGRPFTTFAWQSAEQQAYRIVINGEEVIKAFGTDKSFTLDEPLNDGEYTAEIYVQGLYGLWSRAGTISFSVKNVPGAAVTLTGLFDVDAELTWATEDDARDFYVYRDGVRIGRTEKLACADRLTLGEHGYYVLNRLADNNYTKSNLVHGSTASEETRIRLFNESGWTILKLSSASTSQQTYKYERQHTARHITGAKFPLLELSMYEDEAVSLDVAFMERIDIRVFEAMKGQVVVIKCRGDNVIVGPMVSLQKVVGDFFTSYSFAIQRIDYEDVIDVQDN